MVSNERLFKNRIHSKKMHKNARLKALKLVGRGIIKCVRCGCDLFPFIEINHKNGGGRQEEKYRKDRTIHRMINSGERSIDDLELLCRPCNSIHYLELRYTPIPLVVKFINNDWESEL